MLNTITRQEIDDVVIMDYLIPDIQSRQRRIIDTAGFLILIGVDYSMTYLIRNSIEIDGRCKNNHQKE